MHPATKLACFALNHCVGVSLDAVAEFLTDHLGDQSQALPRALRRANDQSWRAVALGLAGDGFLAQVQSWVAVGEMRTFREQVRHFLNGHAAQFGGHPAEFRKTCLDELGEARRLGLLRAASFVPSDLAQQVAVFRRFAAPHDLIRGATHAVTQVADELARPFPHLGQLLREPTPTGLPLLAVAFVYFFRREVETQPELAQGLTFQGVQKLGIDQATGFAELGQALDTLGDRFDQALDQLAQIGTVVGQTNATVQQTQAAVLDLQEEMQRLGDLQSHGVAELRLLMGQVLGHLHRLDWSADNGAARPQVAGELHGLLERCIEERSKLQLPSSESLMLVLDRTAKMNRARTPTAPLVLSAPSAEASAQTSLDEAAELWQRVEHVAHEAEQAFADRQLKVAVEGDFAPPVPHEQVESLRAWLDKLATVVHAGKVRAACVGLDKWTAAAQACLAHNERCRDDNLAPLRNRQELRGLFESLLAKARCLGRVEQTEMAQLARDIGEQLRRRPTPLEYTRQLVARLEARLL